MPTVLSVMSYELTHLLEVLQMSCDNISTQLYLCELKALAGFMKNTAYILKPWYGISPFYFLREEEHPKNWKGPGPFWTSERLQCTTPSPAVSVLRAPGKGKSPHQCPVTWSPRNGVTVEAARRPGAADAGVPGPGRCHPHLPHEQALCNTCLVL